MNRYKKNRGVCPVSKGTLVDVKYENGDKVLSVMALLPLDEQSIEYSGNFTAEDWRLSGHSGDIIWWRISHG